MKKIIGYVLLSLLCCFTTKAQKEMNWWYFGVNTGLVFSTLRTAASSTGVVLYNLPSSISGPINTKEGCFTLSDNSGKLIMSGDGNTIYNRNATQGNATSSGIMNNGTLLGGSSSATQSGIIVPKPGNSDRYYAISLQDLDGAAGVIGSSTTGRISYSEVDMTLNGGLGGVLNPKANILMDGANENISAVKKTNSRNWWLIHKKHIGINISMYVWEISSTGIVLVNTYANVATAQNGYSAAGELRFDQTGTRFIFGCYLKFDIFTGEFDPSTGVISGLVRAPGTLTSYAFEFSPDSELVYVAHNTLRQISWATLRAGSQTGVSLGVTAVNIKAGPDGRMYAIANGTRTLFVVQNPNIAGTGCGLLMFNNYLTANAIMGLPAFSASWFGAELKTRFNCVDYNAKYTVEINMSGLSPDEIRWDWGDGSAIQNQATITGQTKYSMNHIYTTVGLKTITITPYKSGVAKAGSKVKIDLVPCDLQANRMIRVNLAGYLELPEE